MRITKEMLEERLSECRQARDRFMQDNKVLEDKVSFMNKLMPHASMIEAMQVVTDALAHTIQYLIKK